MRVGLGRAQGSLCPRQTSVVAAVPCPGPTNCPRLISNSLTSDRNRNGGFWTASNSLELYRSLVIAFYLILENLRAISNLALEKPLWRFSQNDKSLSKIYKLSIFQWKSEFPDFGSRPVLGTFALTLTIWKFLSALRDQKENASFEERCPLAEERRYSRGVNLFPFVLEFWGGQRLNFWMVTLILQKLSNGLCPRLQLLQQGMLK